MRRFVRAVSLVAVLGIVAVACNNSSTQPGPGATGAGPQRGGTLQFGMVGDVSAAFDPAKEYYQVSFEFFKCCLLRTLFSTNGNPVDQGGSVLRPDLAAAPPQISSDQLTWTIPIKQGIHYAPPLQNVEVTAQDFIRAIEREADPKASSGGYSFYYSAIEGFDAFGAGKASSITGLSAPDDHTLQIKVTSPTGDLGWRLALPASAPIPPNPNDPSAPLGIAQGHTKDFGRFFVGTGPYMFQGTDQLDFSVPAAQQKPVAGYVPGRSIVLVRNPSWVAATDDLRPAYVNEIDATIGGTAADLYNKVMSGDLDYVVDAAIPPNVLKQYQTNPDLKPLYHQYATNAINYISMNLAVPPFDDIHVRKAINFAINKFGGRQLAGGPSVGVIAGHIFPDGLINNLLQTYDPYASPNDSGDINKAKAEMAMSKYDTNHDGVCDASVCKNILDVISTTNPAPQEADLYASNLQPLGITLDIKALATTTMYAKCNTLTVQVPLCTSVGWIQDYPDAFTFGPPLFGSESLYPACCNYSAVGASPAQLQKWGYSVTSVPSADSKIAECKGLPVGDQRTTCWANLDKFLMEDIVPWVPRTFPNSNEVTSSRVTNYSFDEFGGIAGYDHFALAPGS